MEHDEWLNLVFPTYKADMNTSERLKELFDPEYKKKHCIVTEYFRGMRDYYDVMGYRKDSKSSLASAGFADEYMSLLLVTYIDNGVDMVVGISDMRVSYRLFVPRMNMCVEYYMKTPEDGIGSELKKILNK